MYQPPKENAFKFRQDEGLDEGKALLGSFLQVISGFLAGEPVK